MKVVEMKKRPLISTADKKLMTDSLDTVKAKIAADEVEQVAYVAIAHDGESDYCYCGADLNPHQLAGVLMGMAQYLLHTYHVSDQLE